MPNTRMIVSPVHSCFQLWLLGDICDLSVEMKRLCHATDCPVKAIELVVLQCSRSGILWPDYLCDPAIELNSFSRQLKTFLFAIYCSLTCLLTWQLNQGSLFCAVFLVV